MSGGMFFFVMFFHHLAKLWSFFFCFFGFSSVVVGVVNLRVVYLPPVFHKYGLDFMLFCLIMILWNLN